MKKVSKGEFEQFIKDKEYNTHLITYGDPPITVFYVGEYEEQNIIAKIWHDWEPNADVLIEKKIYEIIE